MFYVVSALFTLFVFLFLADQIFYRSNVLQQHFRSRSFAPCSTITEVFARANRSSFLLQNAVQNYMQNYVYLSDSSWYLMLKRQILSRFLLFLKPPSHSTGRDIYRTLVRSKVSGKYFNASFGSSTAKSGDKNRDLCEDQL